MPIFAYTARTKDGKIIKGLLEEANKETALNVLMGKGLLVTSLEESKDKSSAARLLAFQLGYRRKRRFHSQITAQDMVLFSRQLGTMLEAGVTLLRALNVLISQVESKKLLKVLEEIKKDIESGKTLRSAMEKHPKVFSNFWLNLIETGEASGHLARSLNQISLFLESSGQVRQKVISAMIYPMVLITVSIVAVFVFITRIIPIFAEVLLSFNIELPTLTKNVIFVSRFLTRYAPYCFVAVVVGVIVLLRLMKIPAGKLFLDRILLRIPIMGDLVEMISCERFANSLGILLESGVSILHALDIVGKTMDNRVYRIAIDGIKEQVREGKSLAIPLERSGVFPVMLVQMITVGEEVGELSKMLGRVSNFYKEKVEVTLTRLTSLIEPIILISMGGLIAILVISMFLPMFKLSQIGSSVGG